MMLVQMAVNSTFVLLLGLGLLAVSGRLDAAARYSLCAITLALVVVLPVLPALPLSRGPALLSLTVGPGSMLAGNERSPSWMTAIWAAGAVLVVLRFLAGVGYLMWQTARRSVSVPEGMPPGCDVRLSSISTPVMWGWFEPTILLPASFPEWTPELRKAAIDHELAHIERRDSWTMLVVTAAQALYWFHPLVWWVSKKLLEQRELAADERVIAEGTDRALYADSLLHMARVNGARSLFGCAMVSGSLRSRVEHVLKSRPKSATLLSRCIFTCGIGLLLLSALLVAARGRLSEQIYNIGGEVSAPQLISKIEPSYGEASRREKVQGTVLLSVVINKDGEVQDVRVERGLAPDLDREAVKAVLAWRFEPATRAGQPVSVQARVEVNFRLL